jgi:uncharacterized protein YhbP (UPF0306 family)
MTRLNVQFNHPAYRNRDLAESITDILDDHFILAMATVHHGEAYINSAHFAYNDRLEMVIFTHPYSEHSQNLAVNPSVAVSVWKRPEAWGMNLQGVQLFGTCEIADDHELQAAIDTYKARFPAFGHIIQSAEDLERGITDLRLYVIKIAEIKLIDEHRFGHRNWITAPVILPVAKRQERQDERLLIPMF